MSLLAQLDHWTRTMVRVEVYWLTVSQSEQLDRRTRTMVRVEVYWLTVSQLEQLDH